MKILLCMCRAQAHWRILELSRWSSLAYLKELGTQSIKKRCSTYLHRSTYLPVTLFVQSVSNWYLRVSFMAVLPGQLTFFLWFRTVCCQY